LSPYAASGQIKVTGSELQLEPATAQTLALAFHELVTNSAKYGALSVEAGRVSVSWDVRDNDALMLSWEEIGGPLVHKPASRGFGTRSVIASIETQLGGQALFDWRAEGLICRLLVPLPPSTAISDAGERKSPPPNANRQMQAGSVAS
jgi:two-component sensor histidine kinase